MAMATVSDLETYLGITAGSDASLSLILNGVNSAIEQFLKRTYSATYTATAELLDGGHHTLITSHRPITSTGVVITDTEDSSIVPATSYVIDKEAGIIYYETSEDNDSIWGDGKQRWSLAYASVETVPDAVKTAALMWSADIRTRKAGLGGETIGDYSYNTSVVEQMPPTVKGLLLPFKRFTI